MNRGGSKLPGGANWSVDERRLFFCWGRRRMRRMRRRRRGGGEEGKVHWYSH
jgi:hypothetical protein